MKILPIEFINLLRRVKLLGFSENFITYQDLTRFFAI